jgi:hypothetical protein
MSPASEDEATNEALDTSERLDQEMKGYIKWGKVALVVIVFLAFLIIIIFRSGV